MRCQQVERLCLAEQGFGSPVSDPPIRPGPLPTAIWPDIWESTSTGLNLGAVYSRDLWRGRAERLTVWRERGGGQRWGGRGRRGPAVLFLWRSRRANQCVRAAPPSPPDPACVPSRPFP